MTDEDKKRILDKELSKIYPQLQINMKKICTYRAGEWADDLLAVALEFWLKKPIDQQWDTYEKGKMENFITYIANMQLKSSHSKFYREYRRSNINSRELFTDYSYEGTWTEEEEDYSEVKRCIMEEIEKLNVYEQELIKRKVVDGWTYAKIRDTYNIHMGHLTRDLKDVVYRIRKKCKCKLPE